ncbi:uncharacterized protein B0P05DRAFT_568488 [Gilbertella persicaria]|uniref:uncharacterized protein n=1 Tax=Gilbertella persicaria TaxID=101096 RepID=UPI00221E97F4|nr:uncharacterized protein B0P05DRAFT_568488 [Gilbertella persicaria]KAI8092319.1 hypothetical protein B0P05DRAFT_568488 [Gilbertella persicaria]
MNIKSISPEHLEMLKKECQHSKETKKIKKEEDDKPKNPNTKSQTSDRNTKRQHRSYKEEQIKELKDIVALKQFSTTQAGFIVGINERTARYYMKEYKNDEAKGLPGRKSKNIKTGKLEQLHKEFLDSFFANNSEAMAWQARDALLESFPEIGSISLLSLYEYLDESPSTFRNLKSVVVPRKTQITLESEPKPNIDWNQSCVFISKAGFQLHTGQSKKGMSVKSKATVFKATCENGVIEPTPCGTKKPEKKADARMRANAKEVTEEDMKDWISYSKSFYNQYRVLEQKIKLI